MAPERRRVFFALWPETRVADALTATARQSHGDCGGRITGHDSIHLTLAFLGDIPAERVAAAEEAAALVAGEPFLLAVDRLGYWKHNRILWAGCEASPAALAALAADLGERLRGAGFALETRPFAAHVTLLRNARCAAVPALAEPIEWPVGEFVLIESTPGAAVRYRPIGRWTLQGKA
jgi:2'-5' RNA ligase